MRTLALLGTLALAGGGASLAAQARPRASLFAGPALVRLDTRIVGVRSTFKGPALAAEGRIAFEGMVLGAGYLGGRLQPSRGTLPRRDVVEGRLFVEAEPLPWLQLVAGPLVRAYVTDSSTERWVVWQARARVRAPLAGPMLGTYLELWRAVSSRVNLAEPVGRVQGGEVGVVFQPPRQRYSLRLAYAIDDALLGSGARRETVEGLSFAVGIGGR